MKIYYTSVLSHYFTGCLSEIINVVVYSLFRLGLFARLFVYLEYSRMLSQSRNTGDRTQGPLQARLFLGSPIEAPAMPTVYSWVSLSPARI